jgi:hypothetical protein
MTLVAFAGPSLPPADRDPDADVDWRPPAEAGDLLRLIAAPPATICLIDGWFDHRPAVRHKEILLLLSAGVRVIGASSIGALRAAEMARFGMIGVGAIFRAYASGRIRGDDEVALIHGPEKWAWRPLSVPLVDVRATLCRAMRRRIVTGADARALIRAARAIHYVDRSWALIAEGAGLPAAIGDLCAAHLIEQKRIDARACIAAGLTPPVRAARRPEAVRTVFLEALAKACGTSLDRSMQARAG